MNVEPDMQKRSERVRMAVLVPTFRRSKDLARCLLALEKQTRPPDQVVVVSRTEDTETAGFLAGFDSTLPVDIVPVTVPGVVAALNAGLAGARADIISFTDDDAAPRPDWLLRVERHFDDAQIGAVGGRDHQLQAPPTARNPKVGRMSWFGRAVGNHHLGTGAARNVDFIKGVNMSYRAKAIEGARFDGRLRGAGAQTHSDMAFSLLIRRRGWRVVYDPDVVVDHFPAQRFDEDQRGEWRTPRTLEDKAFNETLTILEHLSPARRVFFWIWVLAVGTRELPGLLHCLRVPLTRPPAWNRLLPVLRGRLEAARAFSKRLPVPTVKAGLGT